MNYNSVKNQRIKGRFVDREVIYCVSQLVYELSKKAEEFSEYYDDLLDAYQGLPDYEMAAEDNGWEPGRDEFGNAGYAHEDEDIYIGSAEELCQEFDIDAEDYAPEIYEHWIVSDWLADKLEAQGEKVLRDFFGLTIWCRATTGQAILLDGVIGRVCEELGILEGQTNEWEV